MRQNEGPGNALSSEQVARPLAQQVQAFLASSAALGPCLADQWALPLALVVHESGQAASCTASALSLHARTNFEVIEKSLPVAFTHVEIEGGWRVDVSA